MSEEKIATEVVNINATTAWACASGKIIMPWSVRSTRREVKRDMETNYGKPWSIMKKRGHSIIKVNIQPAAALSQLNTVKGE